MRVDWFSSMASRTSSSSSVGSTNTGSGGRGGMTNAGGETNGDGGAGTGTWASAETAKAAINVVNVDSVVRRRMFVMIQLVLRWMMPVSGDVAGARRSAPAP